jgi:hypothetical protein
MNRAAATQARSGTVQGVPRPGGWGWEQRFQAPPQRVRQQAVGQGGRERGSSHHQRNRTDRPIEVPEYPSIEFHRRK